MRSRHPRLSIPFALPPTVKSAQISVLPEFEPAEPFPRKQWHQLEAFQPNVVIGYAYDLTRLANAVESGAIPLTSVDRVIFVLTDCGMPVVSDALRSRLWKVFGVPIYELIVAPGCILLAAECELHSGWHLQPGIAAYAEADEVLYDAGRVKGAHTGFSGAIDLAPCECARNTPRLRDLAPLRRAACQATVLQRAS